MFAPLAKHNDQRPTAKRSTPVSRQRRPAGPTPQEACACGGGCPKCSEENRATRTTVSEAQNAPAPSPARVSNQDQPSHEAPSPLHQPNAAAKPTLSLNNKLYEGGWVHFNVTVPPGLNRKDFVIVQWMTGCDIGEDGHFTTANHFGKEVIYDFPDWSIDSPDTDPIYASRPGKRWNYKETDTGFQSEDKPGHHAFSAVQFRTELHRLEDVAEDAGDKPTLPTPIDTKTWESAWCETSPYNLHPDIEGHCDLGKHCPKPKKRNP